MWRVWDDAMKLDFKWIYLFHKYFVGFLLFFPGWKKALSIYSTRSSGAWLTLCGPSNGLLPTTYWWGMGGKLADTLVRIFLLQLRHFCFISTVFSLFLSVPLSKSISKCLKIIQPLFISYSTRSIFKAFVHSARKIKYFLVILFFVFL